MSGQSSGTSVQVVSVGENSYTLDEEALASVLLREELRDLPVVLVSVAGAYRGGKSFLLGFCLRYLRASPLSQSNGQWLGAESEPLTGFSWRVGSERETTGILLWSEPVITSLSTGEKVAVLLMDTQGTFDSNSTIRDCSTIFALSTLLSSVQVYNISQLIKEDDLQHLQLFTEYGRIVSDEDVKAFQKLQFLVRDWSYPFEYHFGASGGQALLEKTLQINEKQKNELRQLREHIHSCFENISCFLMPHPGFEVSNENFKGCLSDVRKEFKDGLLEYMPLIFDPAVMTPKMINGEKIKARELYTYFKTYMDIFNSDELPSPLSILNATSEAGLLAALQQARLEYEGLMEQKCGSNLSVRRVKVQHYHNMALEATRESFNAKKKLGDPKEAETRLVKLIEDLNGKLSQYVSLNEAKIQMGIIIAKSAYQKFLRDVSGEQPLCLHPRDLAEAHAHALDAALAAFQQGRAAEPDGEDEDEDRHQLYEELDEGVKQFEVMNDQNNIAAVMKAVEHYRDEIRTATGAGCVSSELFESNHERAAAEAVQLFKTKRNRFNEYPDDFYFSQLNKNIKEHYESSLSINKSANRSLSQSAVYTYNNQMAGAWGAGASCWHPEDLARAHAAAARAALADYDAARDAAARDRDRQQLLDTLERRYEELCYINENSNKVAVAEALSEYRTRMDAKLAPSIASLLVLPFVMKLVVLLPKHHESASRAAIDHFKQKRNRVCDHTYDPYLSELNSSLEASYESYKNPLKAVSREVGLLVE